MTIIMAALKCNKCQAVSEPSEDVHEHFLKLKKEGWTQMTWIDDVFGKLYGHHCPKCSKTVENKNNG